MFESFYLEIVMFLICPILSMIFLSLAIFCRWHSIDAKTGLNSFSDQGFRIRGNKVVNRNDDRK